MLIGKQNDKKMKEEKREKMIQENNLVKYYSELAGKLDEIIPCEWERIVLYAEETGDVSAASFYFFTSDSQYYYSENIWEEFDVDEDDFDELKNQLMDITRKLWWEFKNAGEEAWSSFTFNLDKDFKFKMNYCYEKNDNLARMEKVLRWAYDELEIIPRDNYRRSLLKEYLEEQGRELPEELKEI